MPSNHGTHAELDIHTGRAQETSIMSFKAESKKIASKEGIPMKNAAKILAASSRNASHEAVKKNPSLLKVRR